MKVILFAGGKGTRMEGGPSPAPKPLTLIGDKPILWHIMKRYAAYGLSDFILCLGHGGDLIRAYVETVAALEPWRVTCLDTGESTPTGGRLRRAGKLLAPHETFALSYADGLADIDIGALLAFHEKHGKLATLTAAHPPARFGELKLAANGAVTAFREKKQDPERWVNAGFFVLSAKVLSLLTSDALAWEEEPLSALVAMGELMAYRHEGFWRPMDTPHEQRELEDLWQTDKAPWR